MCARSWSLLVCFQMLLAACGSDAPPVDNHAELIQTSEGTLLNRYHPVTVKVTDSVGAAISKARVVFKVTGPTPVQQIGTTGTAGTVVFSYRSAVEGADTVDVQVDFDQDEVIEAEDLEFSQVDDLQHFWVATSESLLDGTHEFDLLAVNLGASTVDVYDLGTSKYLRLSYDTFRDQFSVDGRNRTLSQFEQALNDLAVVGDLPLLDGAGGVGLSTVFYNSSPSPLVSWFLLETG